MPLTYDRSDTFLADGFAVIWLYDPATYERMVASRWYVARMGWTVRYRSGDAYGATHAVGDSRAVARSEINPDAITVWSNEHGVKVSYMTADILVHEFRHIHQPENMDDSAALETPAFMASTAFADLLPTPDGPRLAALSEETRRAIETGVQGLPS